MRIRFAALGALVLAGLLTGCGGNQPTADPSTDAPAPSATETPEATVEPTETPTPTPSPTNSESQPVYAFDGNCANVLSADEVSAGFGTAMSPNPRFWSVGTVEGLGGIRCAWSADGVYMGGEIVAWVLPEDRVPAEYVDADLCESDDMCQATRTADGVWYGVLITHVPAGIDRTSLVSTLADAVVTRGADFDAPQAPVANAAAWNSSALSCGSIAALLQSPEANAEPVTVVGAETGIATNDLRKIDSSIGAACVFETTATGADGTQARAMFSVLFAPAGAPAYEAGVRDGNGTPVDIVGGSAAQVIVPFLYEGDGGILATDGTNNLLVAEPRGFEPASFIWAAEQLLAALAPRN